MSEFVGDTSWVFELVADDDRVRGRALARHQSSIASAIDANHWANRLWARAGSPAPAQLHLAAEMDQARATVRHHLGQTVFELVDASLDKDPVVREQHARFALLYLVWERRHPADWRARATNWGSAWARKELVLRELTENGVPAAIRPELTDLLAKVVQYSYRCKDWRFAALAHHLRGDRLDERIQSLLAADDPLVRLRAEFVLDLAGRPELRVRRATWSRWLANGGAVADRPT